MKAEYGTCDMAYLKEISKEPGTVTVDVEGATFHVPVALFDNRTDLTTFLRKDEQEWTAEEIQAIHGSIKATCDELWTTYSRLRK